MCSSLTDPSISSKASSAMACNLSMCVEAGRVIEWVFSVIVGFNKQWKRALLLTQTSEVAKSIILQGLRMQQDHLKRTVNSQWMGTSTKLTASQETSLSGDIFGFQDDPSLSNYQSQIESLERDIRGCEKPAQSRTYVKQPHFSMEKCQDNGRDVFVITAEYPNDCVLVDMAQQFDGRFEGLKSQAQAEINRLGSILFERDEEIARLKEQLLTPVRQQSAKSWSSCQTLTDWNVEGFMKQHSALLSENKNLESRVNQLTNQIAQIKPSQTLGQIQVEAEPVRRPSVQILRVQANRPPIKQGLSLSSSVASVQIKQNRSMLTQTDPMDVDDVTQLSEQLNLRVQQNCRLQHSIDVLNREFSSIKTDNMLLIEDIDKQRLRTEELQKMVNVQNVHIESLRAEIVDCRNQVNTDTLPGNSSRNVVAPTRNVLRVEPATMGSDKVQQLTGQISNLSSVNQQVNYINQRLESEIRLQKLQKANIKSLQSELVSMKSNMDAVVSQRNALSSQVSTLNTNLQGVISQTKNNQGLTQTIKKLQVRIEGLNKQVQDARSQSKESELRSLTERMARSQQDWKVKRVKLEQELLERQRELYRINSENLQTRHIFDEINVHYLTLQTKLATSEQSIFEKDIRIGLLEKKIQETERILQIYKQEVNEKHKSQNQGVVGFGTSNSLTEKSPQKSAQIQTHDELLETAKSLLNNGQRPQNMHRVNHVLEIMTDEFENMKSSAKSPNTHLQQDSIFQRDTTYELQLKQTNIYIQSLLNTISDHELEEETLREDNANLRTQMDRMGLTYRPQESDKGWEDLVNQLQFEKKLTGKLSDQVKVLKEEIFNMSGQLQRKNEQIHNISSQINVRKGYDLRQIDQHLCSIQDEYQKLLSCSRQRQIRGGQVSENTLILVNEIELYRAELEKAVNLNEYLKDCLSEDKQCKDCREYSQLVGDLERRLQNYEKMMMGQLKRIFTSCEKEINHKGRNELHMKIQTLKQKSYTRQSQRLFQPASSRRAVNKSPTVTRYANTVTRAIHKRHTVLDHLVQNERLSLQCILIIMQKIVEQADNQKLYTQYQPILPQNVEIIRYDSSNPQQMIVQICEDRSSGDFKSRIYMAPERLRGCEPNRKALVWNIGLIFHFLVNKKAYFLAERDVLDGNRRYKYQNKLLTELKPIIEPMLQKDISKRAVFSHVRNLIANELAHLRNQNSRR